jgi:hypothetical protein
LIPVLMGATAGLSSSVCIRFALLDEPAVAPDYASQYTTEDYSVDSIAPSTNPSSIRARTGCCSLRTALASI